MIDASTSSDGRHALLLDRFVSQLFDSRLLLFVIVLIEFHFCFVLHRDVCGGLNMIQLGLVKLMYGTRPVAFTDAGSAARASGAVAAAAAAAAAAPRRSLRPR